MNRIPRVAAGFAIALIALAIWTEVLLWNPTAAAVVAAVAIAFGDWRRRRRVQPGRLS